MELKDFKEIKPTGNIDIKLPKPDNTIIGKKEHVELPLNVPFWKQSGFRRSVGGCMMMCGGIMTLFPATSLAGQGIFAVGSGIYTYGAVKAAQNSKPEVNGDKGLWYTIIELLAKLLEAMKKVKK